MGAILWAASGIKRYYCWRFRFGFHGRRSTRRAECPRSVNLLADGGLITSKQAAEWHATSRTRTNGGIRRNREHPTPQSAADSQERQPDCLQQRAKTPLRKEQYYSEHMNSDVHT